LCCIESMFILGGRELVDLDNLGIERVDIALFVDDRLATHVGSDCFPGIDVVTAIKRQ
jgi:hypothetical protein